MTPLYRVDLSDLGILRLTCAPRVIGLSVERAVWGRSELPTQERGVGIMSKVTLATCDIFEQGLAALRDKVDGLNKRAARHKMVPMDVTVVRVKEFFPVYKGGIGHPVPLYRVEIRGVAPSVEGWSLAARVEFNEVVGAIVRIAPGREDDGSYAVYRDCGPVCEHCNSRRYRKDVFVLEDSNGSRKIVGRNCLADFLRCEDADDFARYAEYADLARKAAEGACEDSDEYYGGGYVVRVVSLERYMPVVAMLMRRIGWVSRTAVKEREDCSATADLASRFFGRVDRYTREWIEKNELYADDEDAKVAGCAVEWAKSVCDDGNEYLHTIKKIACAGEVDLGGLDGYAASIIIAYRKACEREALAAERAKHAKRMIFIGSPKERARNVPVVCKGLHTFEGYYGPTTIVRFEHYPDGPDGDDKAVLVWFASGDKERDWTVDAEYVIDYTCKSHDDDDKWGKQTKINRVKDCA